MWTQRAATFALLLTLLLSRSAAVAEDVAETPAERGYRLLSTKAYLPPRLTVEEFEQLWTAWEPALKQQAEQAAPEERRAMAFRRYGFTPPPEGMPPARGGQVQYLVDDRDRMVMTCFACHQGEVAGRVIPGVPNTRFAMQTFYEDIRDMKLLQKRDLKAEDVGTALFPFGGSNGATNAVMFGVILKHYRDGDLNVLPNRDRPELVNHDMDAPAWWHYKRKKRLYADDFAPRSHRALMPFLLVRSNGPERFHEWEADFRDIEAWLLSLESPQYPFAIDEALAAQGERVFTQSCAKCHGSYGEQPSYPEKVIPLAEIGTDPVRLQGLTVQNRADYAASWFARTDDGGQEEAPTVVTDPIGYVAPPLDGVWASAPYFHNGSVPTLWHVLHPRERPIVWRRADERQQADSPFQQHDGYDEARVGLAVVELERGPSLFAPGAVKRAYFDTRQFGKSAAGHDYPDELTADEKRALLEYLKTL